MTHLRENSEGQGGGGGAKTSFRSPPTPNPRACSQASESRRFIPVAFFDFYCTKQIYIACMFTRYRSQFNKENVQHIVK